VNELVDESPSLPPSAKLLPAPLGVEVLVPLKLKNESNNNIIVTHKISYMYTVEGNAFIVK
jgi:hypothetical protein